MPLKVLAINDFHGHLQPPPGLLRVPDPADPRRTLELRAGGAEHLATLVQQLREGSPHHIFVAAGDLVGASPLLSALFHDEPTIESLSRMGLALSAVGNHEFDKGAAELLRLQRGGCAAQGCRGPQAFAGASFQYLAASTVDQASGQTLLPAYRVQRFAGVPVAFIGLTLKATPSMVMPSGVRGLRFRDEVQTVNALVPQLHAQGVQAIVLLIHQGGIPGAGTAAGAPGATGSGVRARPAADAAVPGGEPSTGPAADPAADTCPDLGGPIVEMLPRLDRAVDVVISGHTHRDYICRVDGRLLTSAGRHGQLLTEIDLELDPRSGRVRSARARNHPVDPARSPPDPQQTALLNAYARLAAPLTQRVVARPAVALPRELNAAGESVLGQVIADAQLEATRAAGAVLALTNPGSIRTGLPKPEAPGLRFEQLFAAQPFGNALVTMTLSGAELLRLLEQQWLRQPLAAGRVLQVSAGFSYRWDASRPAGQRVVPDSLRLHGQPIAAERQLRVTVNSFMADGGDHFAVLRQGREREVGTTDVDALEAYLRARPGFAPPPRTRIERLH